MIKEKDKILSGMLRASENMEIDETGEEGEGYYHLGPCRPYILVFILKSYANGIKHKNTFYPKSNDKILKSKHVFIC